ncbi:MAG TPA: FecR domain-containing protein, partial [Verrucomicrobiae bacterium]|nr:FecR domain-containing protein [Verrucomicrobiae bacterium]
MTGLALAACLAVVGAALWLFLLPAKMATLAMADPGVVIERGRFEFKAGAGMALRVGDRVVTPDGGRAMFMYDNEATEVTVHSGTRLGVDFVRGNKQLTLDRGAFVADVAKQDPSHPLSLVTPEAEAIVVGTRFMLSTADTSTKLEVFEGAVRITQGEQGPSMQVPAGYFVNVQSGRSTTLLPLPRSTGGVQLEHWLSGGQGATNELTLDQLMFSGVGVAPGNSRVRGYLHPPLSGGYLFQMSANAKVALKVSSSSDSSDAKTIVATESGASETMSSDVVLMQAGQQYYFELDCESDQLPANFSVSWKMPGGMHRVIY